MVKRLFFVIFLIIGFFALSSCADKYYDDRIYHEGGNAYVFSFNDIKVESWHWNESLNRYESDPIALKGLNEDIFEYGTAIVSMFVVENGVEVTKNLPYEQDFFREEVVSGETIKIWEYTQRTSFDMTIDDIVFYVESTDEFALEVGYFKVVILWDGIIEE